MDVTRFVIKTDPIGFPYQFERNFCLVIVMAFRNMLRAESIRINRFNRFSEMIRLKMNTINDTFI